MKIHTHTHRHTNTRLHSFIERHIHTYMFNSYTHKYIETHLKKNVTVYFLGDCLGGPDMK